jgi:indolepyruvate ferredoxin oxidoreductase beta subunit
MKNVRYDILLVGVGGQGVLTIGSLIMEAAMQAGIPANYYPTKGMAQRGGFVKAELKLGRDLIGPGIAPASADLIIAMEQSEALKAIRFAKPGSDFVLYGHIWQPTSVMLGKAPYPSLEMVIKQIEIAESKPHYIDPAALPEYENVPVSDNIFVLGATLGASKLGMILDSDQVGELVENRWKKASDRNRIAYQAGIQAGSNQ